MSNNASMQQLEAHEFPLIKIFSSDYAFRIPDYQRPYAWGEEQATQLLEDLIEALDRGTGEPYFLGSVVLVKDSEAQADVIDGQQRLTTLTILLAVLRELTSDQALALELDHMVMEPGKIVQGLAARPRLALRARDAAFFRQYVQEQGRLQDLVDLKPDALKTDAQAAIRRNVAVLRERLSVLTEDRRLQLVQMLGARTYLVVVSTQDLASAHRIFSVMNARGLDLSPSDIFKSLVVGALPEGVSDDYARKWEDAEESLGRDDFSDLFLDVRMVFARVRAKSGLLKEFPEQVLNDYLPDRAKEFVDDVVVPYAEAYEQVRDAAYVASQGADQVNLWLRRLAQLDNNDWRPPVMWALKHHGDDPVLLAALLQQVERLAASMLIRRVYATPRANRYAQLLTELVAGDGLAATAFTLSNEERRDTLQRLGGELYLASKVRKYVLLRLDEELAKSPGVIYGHRLITVEHVLPQSPAAASAWLTDFTEDDRTYWTHRLANLVLLNRAKNSEAQNIDFVDKKLKYFTGKHGVATFALTSQVLGEPSWTPSVLVERQKHLLQQLETAWALA